jgi:hypothetical protein
MLRAAPNTPVAIAERDAVSWPFEGRRRRRFREPTGAVILFCFQIEKKGAACWLRP